LKISLDSDHVGEVVHDSAAAAVQIVISPKLIGAVAALEVDAVRDQLEVVLKPMQGVLTKTRGFLGTTLLGDGQVLLVLDVKELLP